MTKKNKFYITTAIDYVNAQPHIGHAYEKILADIAARWHRLIEDDVFYLTGTDENAQKNAQIAKEKGIPIKEFVKQNSDIFEKLCKVYNISNNDFIRTTEKRHKQKVQELFKKVANKGEIYKGKYEGFYCQGCEAFLTEKSLVNGKCPEHKTKPEFLSEEAYFFKLSKYKNKIIKLLENGLVLPKKRANELLSRLKEEGLKDLCVSRTNLDWGIDSPINSNFKIYVWFDALGNYITGAGKKQEYWPAQCHAIGKGINWFHSVIWPAILLSAGYKLPKNVWVHGYLTINGQKMSKSLGNVINPLELAKKYPVDSIRYFLAREVPFENDGDFSEAKLVEKHNNELANKLGNLISRTTTLAEKYGLEKTKTSLNSEKIFKKISQLLNEYHIDKALNEIFAFIDKCNEHIQKKKPWKTQDKKVLYELINAIKDIAILLSPFIPETSEKIAKALKFKISLEDLNKPLKVSKIKKAPILFKKIKYTPSKEKVEGVVTMNDIVEYGDWEKLDLRVAEIKKVEDIEGADKLYKLTLDVGELGKRTICAGLKEFYKKDKLKGKKIILFVNLKPRKIRGIESQGMLLAASNPKHTKVILITPEKDIEPGAKVA